MASHEALIVAVGCVMPTMNQYNEAVSLRASPRLPPDDADTAPLLVALLSANEDSALMGRLEEHLGLTQDDDVTLWGSHTLLAGSEESIETPRALAKASVIVVGLSIKFFASKAFPQIARELCSQRRRGAELIPLLLGPVDWEASMFGDLRPLPGNRLPIELWACQDAALVQAVSGIRKVIAAKKRRWPLVHRPGPGSGTSPRGSSIAWKIGAFALGAIAVGTLVYELTRPPDPPDRPPPAPPICECTCSAGEPGPARVAPCGIPPSPSAEPMMRADMQRPADEEKLVFERIPWETPHPAVNRAAAAPTSLPAEPAPSGGTHQGEPTSSVVVPMSPGSVLATLGRGTRLARNFCKKELAGRGTVRVSIQFDNKEGRPEKIYIASTEPLDDSARQCVRRAFLGARVAPGNGGYRANNWLVQ